MGDRSPSFPALRQYVDGNGYEVVALADGSHSAFPIDTEKALAELDRAEVIVQAAQALSNFLENEKETFEPPSDLLDQYAALETHADYDREEALSLELWKAIYQ